MARSKKSAPVKNKLFKPDRRNIQNEKTFKKSIIRNSLTEALGLFNPFESAQLSQVDTLFKNLRYYLLSNFRQILSQMYVEFGIVQTIIDMPVDDALRGGIDIKTKMLDENQLLDLHTTIDRRNDMHAMGQGLKWNRLFGGSGVIILTDQPPGTELNLKLLKKDSRLDFMGCDLWELYSTHQNLDSEIIQPVQREMPQYDYYGVRLDRSRVMQMTGLVPPSFIRQQLRGWGFSVIEPIVRPLNQFLKASDLAFEVLDEFKLDIFKLNALATTLDRKGGTEAVQKRVNLANKQKSYQNALVLDSLDDYEQKQLSFSGLAETMEGIRLQLACETHFPQAKLFGEAAQGFSSGQDSIENYNAMIESTVRQPAKYHILRMVELRCQQLFGIIPDDLSIEFKPLRILGAEAEENVKNAKFTRTLQSKEAGELTSLEFREQINKDKLLPTQLDTDDLSLQEVDEENEEDLGDEESNVATPSLPKSTLRTPEVKE